MFTLKIELGFTDRLAAFVLKARINPNVVLASTNKHRVLATPAKRGKGRNTSVLHVAGKPH